VQAAAAAISGPFGKAMRGIRNALAALLDERLRRDGETGEPGATQVVAAR
jgi:hypothetical protein